jgi:TMEM199 family protein
MVLLTTTPAILSALSSLPPTLLSSVPKDALPIETGDPIPHSTLIILSRLLRSTSPPQKYTLNTLLRNAHPYASPPPTTPPKSPEYIALMTRLRAEQEQREYRSMLASSSQHTLLQMSGVAEGEEKDDVTPSLVINILISIIMCGAAMFYMTRWWSNDGVRVLVSLGTAIVVGIAEVVVYAGYLRKVKESRTKEQRVRERKIVVGSESVGGKSPETGVDEVEREEIWGKGVNGGMRRRVREKWEREEQKTKDAVQEKS